ncbi:MAG: hypothetical protein IJ568_06395 [Bacilli bacterium]|nr:hypothetical protein [Bacilli bacterium]
MFGNPVDLASLLLQIVNLEMLLKDFNNTDLMKNLKIIIEQNNELKKLLERRENMEELIEKIDAYIEKKGKQEFHTVDKDELFKVVDIYKDLKEVKNMNGYGNEYGRGYGYNGYNAYNEYNRRGVDAKYRASSYMDGMRGSYEAYEDDRNEFNAGGNYGAKEDGLKDLESMLHYNHKLLKYIKETATSPEEKEILKKHFSKMKEIMNV